MFDFIFKSKTKKEILKLLFSFPEKKFYLSEIARKINSSIGSCQRELEKLVKSNILSSKKKNNLKLYFVDKKNTFYNDLKNIINKTIGLEGKIKTGVKRVKGVEFAFIFGSYVKGNFSNDSDIDLFLIGDISEDEVFEKFRAVEKEIGREINYHIYSKSEFKKKFKSDSFLQNIIKNNIFLTDNKDEFGKLFR
jgi:predicted nucleotidyltransferase